MNDDIVIELGDISEETNGPGGVIPEDDQNFFQGAEIAGE